MASFGNILCLDRKNGFALGIMDELFETIHLPIRYNPSFLAEHLAPGML
jgi:hypothetical protein